MNLNKVILIGRTTKAPELRRTPGGTSVSTFSIATSRVWTDKAKGKQEETEFHNVVAWGRTAEIASQFLTKGQLVSIEGRLKTRKWEDKGGVKHYMTEIMVESLHLGPKPNGIVGKPATKQEEATPVINLDEEPDQGNSEIPF